MPNIHSLRISMNYVQISVLALIQGFAELLPISSSAHVIVAEKLMGLDPTTPEMTLFLVLLHTGTMFSVLVYFWGDWKRNYFFSEFIAWAFIKQIFLATLATGIVGLVLKVVIEKVLLRGSPKAEVESLFGNLTLISLSLAAAGLFILFSAQKVNKKDASQGIGARESIWIGLIQGLCLPFRGFSRSGATISMGLMLGLAKAKVEEFSFFLAMVLTPAIVGMELHRLWKSHPFTGQGFLHLLYPGLWGMVFSFLAGLLALKWLSSWLNRGRWGWFGIYCLGASLGLWILRIKGIL